MPAACLHTCTHSCSHAFMLALSHVGIFAWHAACVQSGMLACSPACMLVCSRACICSVRQHADFYVRMLVWCARAGLRVFLVYLLPWLPYCRFARLLAGVFSCLLCLLTCLYVSMLAWLLCFSTLLACGLTLCMTASVLDWSFDACLPARTLADLFDALVC